MPWGGNELGRFYVYILHTHIAVHKGNFPGKMIVYSVIGMFTVVKGVFTVVKEVFTGLSNYLLG